MDLYNRYAEEANKAYHDMLKEGFFIGTDIIIRDGKKVSMSEHYNYFVRFWVDMRRAAAQHPLLPLHGMMIEQEPLTLMWPKIPL